MPSAWKHKVLTIGPSRKFQSSILKPNLQTEITSLQDSQVEALTPKLSNMTVFVFDKPLKPWKRTRQPNPGFLSGESLGQRSLVGCSPWGCKESDTTEAT